MKRSVLTTDLVASRELKFVGKDGLTQSVLVSVYRPVKEESGPWCCAYAISAQTFEREFRCFGEDSMQALLLAIRTTAVELDVLAKGHHGSFTWYDDLMLGLTA